MKIESTENSSVYLENISSMKKNENPKGKIENNNKIEFNNIKDKVETKLKELGIKTDNTGKGIKYEKDEDTNKWVVKIYNEKTGKIIQQIPAREVINVAKGVEELLGNVLDKKV